MTAIRDVLTTAIRAALDDSDLPVPSAGVELTPPRQREHGDWATNVALQVAKPAGRNPREVAADLRDLLLGAAIPHVTEIEIAGPGFLNFHLAPSWLHDVLPDVLEHGPDYGTSEALSGERINLEFVSANPTGPIHAGGGRWTAVGDALANLLASQGADVHREYLLNDAGNQLDAFAASLLARMRGEEPPEDGYQGQYIADLADALRDAFDGEPSHADALEWGYARMLQEIRTDLERIGVRFDTWFSERTLHAQGAVDRVIEELRHRGHAFDHEGAVWLRSTEFGDTRDRVLIKSDGSPTYLAADLAYHLDKLGRGFTHLINIWGADHHGQVASLQAGLRALGVEPRPEFGPEPEVILGQLVNLMRGGEPVRISKRAGDIITLADVLDEVDADACRLTFLLQGIDHVQTFDIDVVTSQSMENPVYYVQYAHARIASMARLAAERGVSRSELSEVDLAELTHERELDLLRSLAAYPEVVADAAHGRAPHRVTTWVREFAGRFHGFYHDCRVLPGESGVTPAQTQARLWLIEACRVGLANALALLGVHAPDRMDRLPESDEGGAQESASA
ncbi:MAG TPA: arginine--tRNA ligase [Acidimicrobiia bacterium]|nr:arginine--tRNA ligase [Acidimicrobiia bacterium]